MNDLLFRDIQLTALEFEIITDPWKTNTVDDDNFFGTFLTGTKNLENDIWVPIYKKQVEAYTEKLGAEKSTDSPQ